MIEISTNKAHKICTRYTLQTLGLRKSSIEQSNWHLFQNETFQVYLVPLTIYCPADKIYR